MRKFKRNPSPLEPTDKLFWKIIPEEDLEHIDFLNDDLEDLDLWGIFTSDQLKVKLVELPDRIQDHGFYVSVLLRIDKPANKITVSDYFYEYERIVGESATGSYLFEILIGRVGEELWW